MLDHDLEQLTKEELAAEVRRLRDGIRRHRDSSGHDLCWHHPQLWNLLPEKVTPELAVPDWPQFLRGCLRYRESLDVQVPDAPRVADELDLRSSKPESDDEASRKLIRSGRLARMSDADTLNTSMPALAFTPMTDQTHLQPVVAMMRALYSEDPAASPADQSRFPLNIASLLSEPSRGRIVLFNEGGLLCGYALLVPYWSNEFGGTVLFVDEIFVVPEARNKGIGRSFFTFLEEQRPFHAVALALEVSRRNAGARRLYESLGFSPRDNLLLTYRFGEGNQKNPMLT